jgi:hypothetical protein
MLEALMAAGAVTGLFALAKGSRGQQRYDINPALVVSLHDQGEQDLPCPWCYGPTKEADTRCRGCGRSFG